MWFLLLYVISLLISCCNTLNVEFTTSDCLFVCPTSSIQIIELNCSVSGSDPVLMWNIEVNQQPHHIFFVPSSSLNINKYNGESNGIEVTLNSVSLHFLSSIVTLTIPPFNILNYEVTVSCFNLSRSLQLVGKTTLHHLICVIFGLL